MKQITITYEELYNIIDRQAKKLEKERHKGNLSDMDAIHHLGGESALYQLELLLHHIQYGDAHIEEN